MAAIIRDKGRMNQYQSSIEDHKSNAALTQSHSSPYAFRLAEAHVFGDLFVHYPAFCQADKIAELVCLLQMKVLCNETAA